MDTESKRKRQIRTIRIVAAIVIILASLGIGYSMVNFNTSVAKIDACTYAVTPEESGLTPTIYVDLKDSESMDLTFGELTKFHAECQRGKVRYWVLTIDDFCIRETIELDNTGTWSCILSVDGMEGWSMRMGGLWAYPQGLPENGWIETNPVPLMTPIPVPPPGSVIG